MKKHSTHSLLKSLLVLALALCVCLPLFSCGDTPDPDPDKVYTVGIVQLAPHEALDAATKGFQDALKAILGEDKVVFDVQNAAGDSQMCSTIVNSFVAKKVDLIMANATPA